MSDLTVILFALAAILPDLIRIVGDELARRHATIEAERTRAHEREENRLERESALRVALASNPGSQ
jgi:hypothetical protein